MDNRIPIYIIGLFDLDGAWPGGRGQQPAVEMGIDHINRESNLLSDYRLEMISLNTKVR